MQMYLIHILLGNFGEIICKKKLLANLYGLSLLILSFLIIIVMLPVPYSILRIV